MPIHCFITNGFKTEYDTYQEPSEIIANVAIAQLPAIIGPAKTSRLKSFIFLMNIRACRKSTYDTHPSATGNAC